MTALPTPFALTAVSLFALFGCSHPERAPADVPQSQDSQAAVSESSAPSGGAPSPPIQAPAPSPAQNPASELSQEARQGLTLTINGETLRLDSETVSAVELGNDPYRGGAPTITVVLREEAAAEFARLTGANVMRQAIVALDGDVLMSATINGRISGGRLTLGSEAVDADPYGLLDRVRAATGTLPSV